MPEDTPSALTAMGCVVYRWDLATDTLQWSENIDAVFGAGAARFLSTGQDFLAACGGEGRDDTYHRLTEGPETPDPVTYEGTCRLHLSPEAHDIWALDQGRWFAGPDGRPSYAVGTLRRMPTELTASSGRGIDALTGAPTRRRLMESLEDRLRDPHRAAKPWALMLVGLDDLGRINERFGFEAADQLIVSLAQHLRVQLRDDDLLVRFSGNKFAILLATADRDVTVFGEGLIERIRHTPLSAGEGAIPISITIGALPGAHAGVNAGQLIARLQEAHERAKRRGRGRFYLDERSGQDANRRLLNLKMADEIVQAIEDDRVTVALQPVVHADTRALAFSEALARIAFEPGQHRYGGHRLVAAAERLGLMGGLDRRVLHKVAATMRRNPALHLSINVSASSIGDEEWMALFHREVDESIGRRLILELTESVAVDDLPTARHFIGAVRKAGVRIAIDDFGAGATSFRNLRKLDVDIVKIDGSFVLHMIKSSEDRAFVQALLTLARQLGIQTVAEWVQTETAATMLLEWGCDYFQGALSGLAQPLAEPGPPARERDLRRS